MVINIGDKVMVDIKGEPTRVLVSVIFNNGDIYGMIDDKTSITFPKSLVIKRPNIVQRLLAVG